MCSVKVEQGVLQHFLILRLSVGSSLVFKKLLPLCGQMFMFF